MSEEILEVPGQLPHAGRHIRSGEYRLKLVGVRRPGTGADDEHHIEKRNQTIVSGYGGKHFAVRNHAPAVVVEGPDRKRINNLVPDIRFERVEFARAAFVATSADSWRASWLRLQRFSAPSLRESG